jgi:XapX domain-containing protein
VKDDRTKRTYRSPDLIHEAYSGQMRGEERKMLAAIIGLLLGLAIGAGCRFFDIPSPAPPRLIGACPVLAMSVGFVTADHLLPAGKTLIEMHTP